jgi:hypothetical protein
MGNDLENIRFNHRQIASFMFKGPDLHAHDKDYINGQALVNPLQLKEALNRLRDILFNNIREKETRYDRTRAHRPYKINGGS